MASARAVHRPILAENRSGQLEGELVREATQGSQVAVDALVRRHWPNLYRTAFLISGDRAAAEDIAQDAMLAALDRLDDFDTPRRLGPWLHRIVANRSIDWVRAQQRRGKLEQRAAQHTDRGDDIDRALPEPMAEALNALSELDRAIVVLRHLFDYLE